MSGALRDNGGKPTLSQLLLFLPALRELSRHCDAGRAKYPDTSPGVPNWTLGNKPDDEYLDAALRHIAAHVGGELRDQELGTLHLTAATWNLLAIVTLNYADET